MTSYLLMPLESVLPTGWRESLDPFASPPPGLDRGAAQKRAQQLSAEFSGRCATIDAQLRARLGEGAELQYLSGIRAWSVRVGDGVSSADLARIIADIPVQIMPEATFEAF